MPDSYSEKQVQEYLAGVKADVESERIDPDAFGNDFSFHQARIEKMEFDLTGEKLSMQVRCVDWLQQNTGTANPYLPHRLVFHDTVQFHYRNREARKETRIFDLKVLTGSDLLIEAKSLYGYRDDKGLPPIALHIQMPLDDSELMVLCSELLVHVGDRVVRVAP